MAYRFPTFFAVMLFAFAASGRAAVALTAAPVGGGVAANHQLGGIAYRTFTAPLPRVRSAAMTALKRMGIKPDGSEKIEYGERLLAKAGDPVGQKVTILLLGCDLQHEERCVDPEFYPIP